jgi:spermidine synthase
MEGVSIPENESGTWKISKFTVSKEEAQVFNMRASSSSSLRGQYMYEGSYTRLTNNGHVIMSDTPQEMSEHSTFVRKAKGNVLINGLGIGMVLKNVLLKPNIDSVVVVELSEDVINLVGDFYKDHRLSIHHADAFKWTPPKGTKFHAIWHDIWPDKSIDNIADMSRLHRRYARWLMTGGFQDSWARKELKYRARKKR